MKPSKNLFIEIVKVVAIGTTVYGLTKKSVKTMQHRQKRKKIQKFIKTHLNDNQNLQHVAKKISNKHVDKVFQAVNTAKQGKQQFLKSKNQVSKKIHAGIKS